MTLPHAFRPRLRPEPWPLGSKAIQTGTADFLEFVYLKVCSCGHSHPVPEVYLDPHMPSSPHYMYNHTYRSVLWG